ncbi:SIMPL domain-containing protein [Colwelliaceae bacterium 6441]
MYKIVVLLFSLSFLPISLANDSQGIEVKGKGSVMTIPDVFSLTVSVKERGRSASKTKDLVDDKSSKIVTMFIKNGISEQAIDTSQVRMFPIFEKPSISLEQTKLQTRINAHEKIKLTGKNNPSEHEERITRFEVSRTITISFNQLSVYDQILDKMVKLGVSNISPIEMSMSEPDKYYQQALSQAITSAQIKAKAIAEQTGVKLGRLIALKESGYQAPMNYSMAMNARADFNTTVTKKAVSAQVIAIYAIE